MHRELNALSEYVLLHKEIKKLCCCLHVFAAVTYNSVYYSNYSQQSLSKVINIGLDGNTSSYSQLYICKF